MTTNKIGLHSHGEQNYCHCVIIIITNQFLKTDCPARPPYRSRMHRKNIPNPGNSWPPGLRIRICATLGRCDVN